VAAKVKELHALGMGVKAIGKELHIDRKTVHKAIEFR